MKARSQSLLLHPLFLISLGLLLLNDFYLKYEFHNDLTGKLSDFAGLFVLAVFLVSFFPFYKNSMVVFCALFFCWWKSNLSDSLIYFFNNHLSLPIERVVDYTDLSALLVLPLVYCIKPRVRLSTFARSIAVYMVGIIAFFSFCATSAPRGLMYYSYRENDISFYESFTSALTEADILKRLDPGKRGYRKDSVRFYHLDKSQEFYYGVKDNNDSAERWLRLKNNADTALFVRKESASFFIIPRYILQGDTLYNLEVRIYSTGRKKKQTGIEIESFQTKRPMDYSDFYYGKKRKRYKRHFKELLER